MSLHVIVSLLMATQAAGTILADMENGAEFTKCISIADLEGKRMTDDITLVDRESGGCCPDGTAPGVKHYSKYYGAQVICGFQDDGTIKLSTGSSNGEKTCTYNKCFILKINEPCEDGSMMFINGCCSSDGKKANYRSDCQMYSKNFNTVYGNKVNYCLSYHKNYKMEGTSDKSDDIVDGKLSESNLYLYTACTAGGSSGGSSGSSGGSSGSGGISCNYGTKTSYGGSCSSTPETDTFKEYSCGSSYDSCVSLQYSSEIGGCTSSVVVGYCATSASGCEYYDKSMKGNSAYEDYKCTECKEANCNTKELGGGSPAPATSGAVAASLLAGAAGLMLLVAA